MRFRQVDVFTRVPFRGNPVAVVLDSMNLEQEQMQQIARWTNLSETTFVLPPTSAAADYRLRIFTPRAELPFAGHPTIGSAHAVIEAGIAKPRQGRLVQECGAGNLELRVEDGETIWLESPRATETRIGSSDVLKLKEILKTEGKQAPVIINVGPRWLVTELASADAVDALTPDMAALAELSNRLEIGGVTVYGKASDAKSDIHVRSFAPAHGIPEDPVCGSGNISVAAYRRMAGQVPAGGSYAARQGMQLGRDGQVSIRFEGDKILLGGSAVTCVEGTLRLG